MACLSYNPTNVNYRDNNMTRTALIGIRRGLLDSVIDSIQSCDLFSKDGIYPRRYFEDLMLDQKMASEQEFNQKKVAMNKQQKADFQ